MIRVFLLFFLISSSALACVAHDEQYYRLHPRALQEAIKVCPQKQACGVSCARLKQVALDVNKLAYELRLSPQDYGKKILALQELMAKQPVAASGAKASSQEDYKQELRARLAIVKWLESPAS